MSFDQQKVTLTETHALYLALRNAKRLDFPEIDGPSLNIGDPQIRIVEWQIFALSTHLQSTLNLAKIPQLAECNFLPVEELREMNSGHLR